MEETVFKLQTTVCRKGDEYRVTVEASGFRGEHTSYSLSSAFDGAYQQLTEKLLEGTSAER